MANISQARLFEIQTSPQTYCTEPDGPQEQFDAWRSTFDLEAKKGEISDLLVSVNEVRSIYTKLVRLSCITLLTARCSLYQMY